MTRGELGAPIAGVAELDNAARHRKKDGMAGAARAHRLAQAAVEAVCRLTADIPAETPHSFLVRLAQTVLGQDRQLTELFEWCDAWLSCCG
jgi:hypothetical protein